MEVSRIRFELLQADEALTKARAEVHLFRAAAVRDVTGARARRRPFRPARSRSGSRGAGLPSARAVPVSRVDRPFDCGTRSQDPRTQPEVTAGDLGTSPAGGPPQRVPRELSAILGTHGMRVLGTHPPASAAARESPGPRRTGTGLRWTWRPSLRALFASLDPEGWERTRRESGALLAECPPERLARCGRGRRSSWTQLSAVRAEIGLEDDAQPAHPAIRAMRQRGDLVAYFSAEFGLTEVLPIYAGGLGVLAGDHLKSASDLGLPLVGVGLFYGHGYFRQSLRPGGGAAREPTRLSTRTGCRSSLARTPDGGPPVGHRDASASATSASSIRLVTVGRVPLLLLDTNLEENDPEDREITARLYGGDQETRIRQEIVLGIGGLAGARARCSWRPTIRHLNEGHAAFVGLERIRQLVAEEGLTFAEARERAAAGQRLHDAHARAGGDRPLPPGARSRSISQATSPARASSSRNFSELGQEAPGKPGRALFDGRARAAALRPRQRRLAAPRARVPPPVARSAARARRRGRADPRHHQRRPPRHLDRPGGREPLARGEPAGRGPAGILAPPREAARKARRRSAADGSPRRGGRRARRGGGRGRRGASSIRGR